MNRKVEKSEVVDVVGKLGMDGVNENGEYLWTYGQKGDCF